MTREKANILITGLPGTGKTTFIINLAKELKDLSMAGFYTAEIREAGVRKGFELVGLDGRQSILSHIDIKSAHRVGRYGVDVLAFEKFLESIGLEDSSAEAIIIDEIGRMECSSERFRRLVERLLDSEHILVATIALKGGDFISRLKQRTDVRVHLITAANRDVLIADIASYIRDLRDRESH